MLRKAFSAFAVLFLLAVALAPFRIETATAETIAVPDDYPTIQEAINNANEGDTIFVSSGIYYENIVVNKTVSLVGENRSTTIIDGNGFGTVLSLTANNVTISGFTIQNHWYYYGIKVYSVDNRIINNTITWNSYSIMLVASNHNNISGNKITNSQYGIGLGFEGPCDANIISDNVIANNSQYGVGLWSWSKNNRIISNVFEKSAWGIGLRNSISNEIKDNVITNSTTAIELGWNSDDNTVWLNTVTNNNIGISLVDSSNNTISKNNVTANNWAGIELQHSSNNFVYHNNFAKNKNHTVYSYNSVSLWDNGYEGNYWSDYNGTDSDGDGIGDTPYIIDGSNQDNYPLMAPYMLGDINHDAIVDIFDVAKIAGIFGCSSADPQWNPHCDVNEDSVIDIFDLVAVAVNFGKEWTPP